MFVILARKAVRRQGAAAAFKAKNEVPQVERVIDSSIASMIERMSVYLASGPEKFMQ
jgi:hypothetical protein